MNCRPGDMAVVVRVIHPGDVAILGRFCRVVSLIPDCPQYPPNVWRIEREFTFEHGGVWFWCEGIPDRILQPIRGDTVDASKTTGRELPNVVLAPV